MTYWGIPLKTPQTHFVISAFWGPTLVKRTQSLASFVGSRSKLRFLMNNRSGKQSEY
jgi:hypothetical protein